MRDIYLTRHRDILDPELARSKRITVIGAGAIGSFVVLSLAKMGFTNITVYDDDVIDPENMNCQFYPISRIGDYKVNALYDQVLEYTGVKILDISDRVGKGHMFEGDYLICAVDNMETRKDLLNGWATQYLIDPRMGAEYATLEVVKQGDNLESYTNTLFSDKDAVQERCTAKSTVYTSMMIAGQVCKVVKDTTMQLDYMRTMDWSIKHNSMEAWSSQGSRL